jgi:hypothetical protein
MKRFEVWMEGYQASGNSAKARKIGETEAESFVDACAKLMSVPPWNDGSFNPKGPSYWGCGLYDNEIAARKVFG